MQQKSRLRVGLIGCGFYGQNHLHAWRDLHDEGADLVAVCDGVAEKLTLAAKTFDAKAYADASEMLKNERLDIVDIVTQMESHKKLAMLAADHGVGAIVQKPFAPTWEDCVAIVDYAKQRGAWLAVHENFRFSTTMRRVKSVLDSGAIGTATWARLGFRTGYDVYRGQPYLRDEKRLVILDVGIHVLDLARFFMGDVRHLSCETQSRNETIKGEDTATIMMKHHSGAVSVVEATYASKRIPDPFPETLLEIEGTEGSIVVSRGEKMQVTTQGLFFEESIGSPLLPWTSRPWHGSQEAVLHANRHMLHRFQAGLPASTSGEDNLKTYALVEAAYVAAETGSVVKPVIS
jgi:D-apiose dehydrogenase